jgi:hypothetical protein
VICLYLIGSFHIGIGICGIIGGSRNNAWSVFCKFIYGLGAILGFVAFLIVGILAFELTAVFSNTSIRKQIKKYF